MEQDQTCDLSIKLDPFVMSAISAIADLFVAVPLSIESGPKQEASPGSHGRATPWFVPSSVLGGYDSHGSLRKGPMEGSPPEVVIGRGALQ